MSKSCILLAVYLYKDNGFFLIKILNINSSEFTFSFIHSFVIKLNLNSSTIYLSKVSIDHIWGDQYITPYTIIQIEEPRYMLMFMYYNIFNGGLYDCVTVLDVMTCLYFITELVL